jgi:transposase
MLYLGIDWAADSHTVTLLSAAGEVLESLVIENRLAGFLTLLETIRKHARKLEPAATPDAVSFAIEDQNQRLTDFLLAQGFQGYLIEPSRMKGYRLRYRSSGNKTDPDDSFVLADVLCRDHDQLPRIAAPDSGVVRALKTLLRDRENFVRDQTRLANRLIASLRQYYPEALGFFEDVAGKTALDFIAAFPGFAAASRLSRREVKRFLVERHCHRETQLVRILTVLGGDPTPVPAVVIRTKRQQALAIIQQLRMVQAAVAGYNAEIERLGAENDEVKRFRSMPGGGPIIGAGLHALFGDDRTRFNSAMAVQSLAGTAPKTIQSGQFRTACFRFGCNRFYRMLLQQMALGALRTSAWAKQYYRGKRKEGKTHQHALRCLANLLLKIAYAIWRDRTEYGEDRHRAQIMRHHLGPTLDSA